MDWLPSSAPHWHLLLNHFPSVGGIIAVGLLLASYYLRSEEDLRRTSLVIFVVIGLLVIPTYITGAAAGWAIGGRGEISPDLIAHHQDAAFWAFGLLLIGGWLAWLALWQYRRFGRPHAWALPTVLLTEILAILAMIQTGSRGGKINHAELQTEEALASAAGAADTGLTASIGDWILDQSAAWVALEAAHFTGMAILFGVLVLLLVRTFGMARKVPFTAFHRLLPLGVFGFMVNVGTGMLFFVADSGRYVLMTNSFFPKMALITIGGVAVLHFTIFDKTWALKPGDDAPVLSKLAAGATLLMWTGVIVYGRLLPYLEGG